VYVSAGAAGTWTGRRFCLHREHLVTEISRQKQKPDIYCSGIQVLNPARLNEVTNEGESFMTSGDS